MPAISQKILKHLFKEFLPFFLGFFLIFIPLIWCGYLVYTGERIDIIDCFAAAGAIVYIPLVLIQESLVYVIAPAVGGLLLLVSCVQKSKRTRLVAYACVLVGWAVYGTAVTVHFFERVL